MLSPAFIRLCCLAVMAPALTKAVREADGFNFMLMSEKNGVLLPSKLSFADDHTVERHLPLVGDKHGTTNGCGDVNNTSDGEFWPNCNGNSLLKASNHVSDRRIPPLSPKPPNNVNGHCYPHSVVAAKAPTLKNCDLDNTMNEASTSNPESMGLISTNTSLDSDFHSKNFNGQFSSPVCQEDLSPHDLETLDDVLHKSSTSPPLSPPGSPKSVSGESTSTVTAHNPPVVTFAELEEAKASYEKWIARVNNLLSRLRKLQCFQVDRHISGQIRLLVSHYQNVYSIPCQRQLKTNFLKRPKDPVDLKAEFLQNEEVRNLSTAALVSLVRKLESSNSGSNLHPIRSSHAEDLPSSDKAPKKLKPEDCAQILDTCGGLLSQVKLLESAIDSDVTESSGDESCDEFGYDDKKTNSIPFRKRALWTWSSGRAPIARRWTWIQSQVKDLEYRVRQMTDLLAQARVAKGTVEYEEPTGTLSRQDPSATILKTLRTVNGFVDHNSHPVNSDFSSSSVQNVPPTPEPCPDDKGASSIHSPSDEASSCSRTRAFKADTFRKRKLLFTTGLHLMSRKAARLSTIRCSCSCRFDRMPCITCGGRYNNCQSVDPELPFRERIALLEPTFHPVLSFQKDVPVSLKVAHIQQTDEAFYQVPNPGPSLPIRKPPINLNPRVILENARHQSKKLTKNAAQTLLSSAKNHSHRHMSTSLKNRDLMISRWKKRKAKRSLKKKKHFRWSAASNFNNSEQGSPDFSSSVMEDGMFFPSISGKESSFDIRRRRDGHEFDIDNIVVPYNVKTAMTFHKLQYKEILTPKWRVVEDSEDLQNGPASEVDEEDIRKLSDEVIAKRHEELEIIEKKIIRGGRNMANINAARRARKGFRHDSRADSSGANTPDHLSWYHQDIMFQDSNSFISGGPSSPVLSPPATPGSVNTISDDSQPSCSNTPSTERKRTVSLTKKEKSLEEPLTPIEGVEYTPFELRTFPLADEVWEEIQKEAAINESLLQRELERKEEEEEKIIALQNEPSSPDTHETTSSTSSALEEDDNDSADPEWTVVQKHSNTERTLVLKLAKR